MTWKKLHHPSYLLLLSCAHGSFVIDTTAWSSNPRLFSHRRPVLVPLRQNVLLEASSTADFFQNDNDSEGIDDIASYFQIAVLEEQQQQQQQHSAVVDSHCAQELQQEHDPQHRGPVEAPTTTTTAVDDHENADDDGAIIKARLLLMVAAALYGTNFSFVKILGESGMSVGVSSTLRFAMAALFTSPWLFKLSTDDRTSNDSTTEKASSNILQQLMDPSSIEFKSTLGGLEVGLWTSIGYVAQAIGLSTTSASQSAFLCSLAVVVVPLFDMLTGKKLLSKQMVGAFLAVLGVAFLELDGVTSASSMMMDHGSGIQFETLCSYLQPLAFGLAFWRMEKTMHQFPEEAARGTAAQLLGNFIVSFLYSAAMGEAGELSLSSVLSADPIIWFSLFWTGCITTALTIYMESCALKTLSATEMTLIFSTEPLWGTAFAGLVMGEHLGVNAGAGALMILSACVFSNLGIDGLKGLFAPRQQVEDNQSGIFGKDNNVIGEDDVAALSLSKEPGARHSKPSGGLKLGLSKLPIGVAMAASRGFQDRNEKKASS